VYKIFNVKPEGKRPLGRPKRRCEDNNMMKLQEVGCGCMGRIALAKERENWRALVYVVMKIGFP
jgi:hypothetical protein